MSVFKRWNGTQWETIGPGVTSVRFDNINNMIAPEFDPKNTYDIGDYVVQSDKLYRCIYRIGTPQAWNSENWREVKLGQDVTELRNDVVTVSNTQPTSENNRIWVKPDNNDMKIPLVEDVMMLPNPNDYGENGQYPRSTGNSIEWVDYGLPSDQQTENAINAWLDVHPEATTTVQDNSLTENKFTNNLKLKTLKDYVTPEMFGAIGDGITDDTEAIQNALDSGKLVFLLNKTYLVSNTINIPVGGCIYGSRNSIIKPTAEKVFHLSSHNLLSSFNILIYSTDVLSVFEVDDTSGSSMLQDIIENISLYNHVSETPNMFTVCHFHMNTGGTYNVIVRDCTFICNKTNGYVARVYSNGTGWMSTVIFSGCFSRAFKWHYFFSEDDKNIIGRAGQCIVTGCTAQCTNDTNAFLFINNQNACGATGNSIWDWSLSTNCSGRPYCFSPNAGNISTTMAMDFQINQMIQYDGTSFTIVPWDRYDILDSSSANCHASVVDKPRVIYIGGEKCVRLHIQQSMSSEAIIRFYLIDRYGINEISFGVKNKKLYISKPIYSHYQFAVKNTNELYLYTNDESSFPNELAIMTLPVAHTEIGYSTRTGNMNRMRTSDIYIYMNSAILSSIPSGLTTLSPILRPLTLTSPNGKRYQITVDNNGVLSAEEFWLLDER